MTSDLFSVIIPTLNEERTLPACLEAIRRELPEAEIVIVDGGSSDRTCVLAEQSGARVLRAAPSRGGQCRAGAAAARGRILCFFHADTRLQDGAGRALREFAAAGRTVATLRLDYRDRRWLCRYVGWTSTWDTYWTKFGDQGIVVRRDLYEKVGGIPQLPLLEDVAFFRRVRALSGIGTLDARIIVSTRRYERAGLVTQLLVNLAIMILYRLGVSAERLARWYRRSAPGPGLAPCPPQPVGPESGGA